MNYLDHLNDSQRNAVEYTSGASLVIAGAGSGKTRVLTYKVVYLLDNGYKPYNILALTFTNKAAGEMKNRIAQLVGSSSARYLNMGTFHSVFASILRREAYAIGYKPNYTIYDESDSRSLIKSIIKQLGFDDKQYKPSVVHNTISMAKNRLITAKVYATDRDALQRDSQMRMPGIYQIYLAYQDRLYQANAMDFDDLLLNTYLLFKSNEDIRKVYEQRFQYVLVDEYQDTNYAQQAIVWLLTKNHQHVCVVGDDAQSIYSFRGANIDNILNFQNIYANVKLFKLEQNYRSTQLIVQAANSLIKKNQRQIPKEIFSHNDEGEKIILKHLYSDREEAAVVCRDIKTAMRREGFEYQDFAILYRTNSQSRTFEEEMRRQSIPYRIYGGMSFYQRKEIKDLIAYFRIVCNNDDEEALRRIINYPARGIGATTVAKISECGLQNNISLWSVVCSPDAYRLTVNNGIKNKLLTFSNMISSFAEKSNVLNAYDMAQTIARECGIVADIFSDTTAEGLTRQDNLQEFFNAIRDFVDSRKEEDRGDNTCMSDFLQEISLMTDLDSDNQSNDNRVSLMTIHSAKGLEFPCVFVVGLEENIFPSPMACGSLRELEEERRLLYVAITRAEKHCTLTTAENRYRYGRLEFDSPSRFLNDIDQRFLSIEGTSKNYRPSFRHGLEESFFTHRQQLAKPNYSSMPQPASIPSGRMKPAEDINFNDTGTSSLNIREGSVIEHNRFGMGTIEHIEGTGENTKATVNFENTGTKRLLLKFAKYRVIKL